LGKLVIEKQERNPACESGSKTKLVDELGSGEIDKNSRKVRFSAPCANRYFFLEGLSAGFT
jgi:hypothetical protein